MYDHLFRIAFISLFSALTALRCYYRLGATLSVHRSKAAPFVKRLEAAPFVKRLEAAPFGERLEAAPFGERLETGGLVSGLFPTGEGVGLIAFRVVLGIPLFGATFLYIALPGKAAWMEVPLPVWLRFVGIGGGMLALVVLTWAHHALGRNFSTRPVIKPHHRLVSHGPYRWIRHPIYSSYFLLFLSAFLISQNWVVGGAGLGIILSLMTIRLWQEERLLEERFGEEYTAYARITGRFLPMVRWGKSREILALLNVRSSGEGEELAQSPGGRDKLTLDARYPSRSRRLLGLGPPCVRPGQCPSDRRDGPVLDLQAGEDAGK